MLPPFGAALVPLALALIGAWAWHTGAAAEAWWWATNAGPPVVTAAVAAGPQGGTIAVPAAVQPAGRAMLTAAYLGERPLALPPPGAELEVDTTAVPDGVHTLRLEAQDRSWRRNRATYEVALTTDNTPPAFHVEGAPPALRAGQPTLLRIGASEPADVQATWGSQSLPLFADQSESSAPRIAFVAVPPQAPASEIPIRVAGRDRAGNHGATSVAIPVEPASLPRQALVVPGALASLATGAVALAEASQLQALTGSVRPDRLWRGEFRSPLAAAHPRTTGFGDRRDYQDGHVTYHGGYDVAAPQGTPIQAAAGGAVVFAGALAQRGTTVVVDHGWGVFTVYSHMAQHTVQPGESVTQGQTLGTVGSTGLSTGPHLHWEVRLRGEPVDPGGWIALSRLVP